MWGIIHFLKMEKYGILEIISLAIRTVKFERSCSLSAAVGKNTDAPSADMSPMHSSLCNSV